MSRPMLVAAILMLACGSGAEEPSRQPIGAGAPCHVTGCSGQVCSHDASLATTCEWLPEYDCYRAASCERQADGRCGWTQTPELRACIERARGH